MRLVKTTIQLSILAFALLLMACNRNKTAFKKNNECDSCCLNKLEHFTDTLNIDTSKSFNYYFNDKQFSLNGCRLKKFRGDSSLKSSLVLFWLKIDNVYRKHKWDYNYSERLGDLSDVTDQLVYEFDFIVNQKSRPVGIEYFRPDWVNDIIKKDSSLLKNAQIKRLYLENKILSRSNKRSYLRKNIN